MRRLYVHCIHINLSIIISQECSMQMLTQGMYSDKENVHISMARNKLDAYYLI